MKSENGEKFGWSDSRVFWVIAAAVVVFVYFFGLTIPLIGPDEPRYAQVAREMFDRGDLVTPTLGGFDWFEKPALLYWLQIAAYSIFGVSEFAARFGSALFGLGTVAALWAIGRTVRLKGSPEFAKLLALMAASTIGIIVFARGASFDIILTFPITAAMAAYWLWEQRQKLLYLALFYFFVGLAVLAKGLVGIVFPAAIVGLYHVAKFRWPSRTLLLSIFWGIPITLATAALWYVPMYMANGWKFIDEFFIQHHFQRYTSNKYQHPQPFFFFFWVLPLMTIPWIPFFFMGVWRGLRRVFAGGGSDETKRDPTIFCLIWLVVPLAFFSLSGSKLPGYILPALPPCIVLAAFAAWRFIGDREGRFRLIAALAGATFAVIVSLLLFVVPQFADNDSVKRLVDEANSRGYVSTPVLVQHAMAHNLEFYAHGRVLRDSDGKQRRLYGNHELVEELRSRGGELLVLVPNEWAENTINERQLNVQVIARNDEHTMLAVSLAQP